MKKEQTRQDIETCTVPLQRHKCNAMKYVDPPPTIPLTVMCLPSINSCDRHCTHIDHFFELTQYSGVGAVSRRKIRRKKDKH